MRRIIEKFKWLQLLLGLVLIALGVLTIVICANVKDDYEKTIFIIWASVLFLIAAIAIGFDLIAFGEKAEYSGLIASGICIGGGIFILGNQEFISKVITTLIPYILISIGGVILLKTIILAIKRIPFKKWLLPFVISVIFLASGIVFLFVKDMQTVIYIALGVLFIALGAVEIIGFVTVMVNGKGRPTTEPAVVPTKGKKEKKGKKKGDPDISFEQPEEPIEVEVDAAPKQIETEDDIKLIE